MRDYLPQEKQAREKALTTIRKIYGARGFDEIETPALEDHSRLHQGLGGDNEKLSFSILKRGLTKEQLAAAQNSANLADLGMRFDLTVPLSRFYASNKTKLPAVFRALQLGPVWRAERPQRGRYRQFLQADIDIIGEPDIIAEIELLAASSSALAALGLQNCVIRICDRRILTALLSHLGFPEQQHAQALITLDKLDKIGTEGVREELNQTLTNQTGENSKATQALTNYLHKITETINGAGYPLTAQAIKEALPENLDTGHKTGEHRNSEETPAHTPPAAQAITGLTQIGAALNNRLPAGIKLAFDPTLVRGMEYYTGTIFEVSHPGSGSSVAGGGRYDGMIGRFLGTNIPAVGFSLGFERIIELASQNENTQVKALALIYDQNVYKTLGAAGISLIQAELLNTWERVLPQRVQKNMRRLLDELAERGYTHFVKVTVDALPARPGTDVNPNVDREYVQKLNAGLDVRALQTSQN